jgi:hypothetical protein
MNRIGLLLLLASHALAAPGLEDLFDPGRVPLKKLARVDQLDRSARLVARGFDPLLYAAPPPAPGQVPQANNIRRRLWPGFSYAARLQEKQRTFARLSRRMGVVDLAALIWHAAELPPAEFARRHWKLSPPARKMRTAQPLQALRHSERQFRAWVLDQLALRVNAAIGDERDDALDVLIGRGLRDPDPAVRVRAARVLGGVADARAQGALERVASRERDPELIGEAARGRVRQGGRGLQGLVRRWLTQGREEIRLPLVRACRRLPGAWVDALLAQRLEHATGRWRDDLETVSAARLFRAPARDGPVSFYGIRTHSRRLLFCIDVSGSMRYPMDGEGGTREPRIERTRRELLRTLNDLPERTRFNIALFAQVPVPWQRGLVPANAANREKAIDFVNNLQANGGTNVHGVLEFALASGADTVFLLTDGEPSVGVIVDPALIVAEMAARNLHARLNVHTIGLARDQNAELLVNLAARNGGEYVAVRK